MKRIFYNPSSLFLIQPVPLPPIQFKKSCLSAKKKHKLKEEGGSFQKQVGASFDTILFATLCKQILQTQKQKVDVKVCMVLATDDAVVAVYKRMMAEADATIATLKARLKHEEQKKDNSGCCWFVSMLKYKCDYNKLVFYTNYIVSVS
jgi:hypothetical protein